jgi:hypothetical protein
MPRGDAASHNLDQEARGLNTISSEGDCELGGCQNFDGMTMNCMLHYALLLNE